MTLNQLQLCSSLFIACNVSRVIDVAHGPLVDFLKKRFLSFLAHYV